MVTFCPGIMNLVTVEDDKMKKIFHFSPWTVATGSDMNKEERQTRPGIYLQSK